MDDFIQFPFLDKQKFYSICIIGSKKVGKTTLIKNFLQRIPKPQENSNTSISSQNPKFFKYYPTKKTTIYSQSIILKEEEDKKGDLIKTINFIIDDTPGYIDSNKINNKDNDEYIREINDINNSIIHTLHLTKGAIIMYSIDDRESFTIAKYLLFELKRMPNYNNKSTILIGNKNDIEYNKRKVTYEEANIIGERNKIFFKEISSENDLSCGYEIFKVLIEKLVYNNIKILKDISLNNKAHNKINNSNIQINMNNDNKALKYTHHKNRSIDSIINISKKSSEEEYSNNKSDLSTAINSNKDESKDNGKDERIKNIKPFDFYSFLNRGKIITNNDKGSEKLKEGCNFSVYTDKKDVTTITFNNEEKSNKDKFQKKIGNCLDNLEKDSPKHYNMVSYKYRNNQNLLVDKHISPLTINKKKYNFFDEYRKMEKKNFSEKNNIK